MEYEPATHTATDRHLGGLPSGRTVSVTVHRYRGGAGPTVYVQAAQHGIELNGPAALRRVHEALVGADLAGTVVAVPVTNPLAFDHRSYMLPATLDARNPNLNRVWPGDPEGSLQERMAARLWPLATEADAVLDLHTGTADMLEHVRFGADDPAARDLARVFGTAYLLADVDTREEADDGGDGGDEQPDDGGDRPPDDGADAPPGDAPDSAADGGEDGPDDEPPVAPSSDGFSGKFRRAAARAGIPAVTAELANSRQVTHDAIRTGVDGVRNVLRALDVRPGDPEPAPDQQVLRTTPEYTLTSASGLFELRPSLGVGDRVAAGEELGAVYCPASFERLETVTAEDGGVAYSLAREAVVVAGERVAAVAAPAD
jgi:predicted deacylase